MLCERLIKSRKVLAKGAKPAKGKSRLMSWRVCALAKVFCSHYSVPPTPISLSRLSAWSTTFICHNM
jgi:hypothetical protein